MAIDNPAGTVKVVGWDRQEVAVTGDVGPGAEGIDVAGDGRRTTIEVDAHGHRHVPSPLVVQVPAGSRVEIDGFMAEIHVSGVKGSVEAETVNGNITVAGTPRRSRPASVNGAVEVSGATHRVKADSVNGGVTIGAGRRRCRGLHRQRHACG